MKTSLNLKVFLKLFLAACITFTLISSSLADSKEAYDRRRKRYKEGIAKRRQENEEDGKIHEGEEKAHSEQEEEPEYESIFNPDNHEVFTRETFMAEYEGESPEHPEVATAKRYFPTKDTSISKERYKALLKNFMDGTVHDEDIDPEIEEEAHLQIQEFIDEYVESSKDGRDRFTLEDFIVDYIESRLHDWMDDEHPESDPEVEPDL